MTTARSWWCAGPSRALVAAGLAASVAACVPPAPAEPLPPETEVVYVEPSTPPELLEAREALADPAVRLARAIVETAAQVDVVRHEVPRGQRQADALADALEEADALDDMVADLREAADDVADDLDGPREAAAALAALGEEVTGGVRDDLASLEPHVAQDMALDEVVDGWSSRGSRSEIVDRFEALVVEAEALVPAAEALPESPPGCTTLRDNRLTWSTAVATKTAELRDRTAEFAGTEFDELVARYALAPLGEDQMAADAEGRPCWAESTPLLAVPDRVEDAVEALEDALNP